WMCGHIRKDKVRNETIRRMVEVASLEEKLRESRLRWFGHIKRRDPGAPVRRCEKLRLEEVRRRRDRPRKSWREVIKTDLEQLSLTEDMTIDRKGQRGGGI